jgi:hypothetical protein
MTEMLLGVSTSRTEDLPKERSLAEAGRGRHDECP